jgi:hypothetical protein
MANSLDQNSQQAITLPKKVWQKPEVYLLDSVNTKYNHNAHENTMTGITTKNTPSGYVSKNGHVHNGAYPVAVNVNFYALLS